MDWLLEISEFPGFDMSVDSHYASDKDVFKAVSKYDKALKNALNDSLDIAIIELRKLAVLYPEAGQVNALLGCCQILEGRFAEALRSLEKARLKDLPSPLNFKIDRYIKEAAKLVADSSDSGESRSAAARQQRPAPEIITAKASRWKSRKLASNKEKSEIIQKLNTPHVAETFINDGMDINWVKIAIVVSFLAIISGIVALGIYYFPKIADSLRNEDKAGDKLEWLLSELDGLKTSNSGIEQLLKDYEDEFYPPAGNSGSTADSGSTSSASAAVSPSPTPEPTVGDIIIEANTRIIEAENTGRVDPKKVMELILSVRDSLEGIDEKTTTEGLTVNVGDILKKAFDLEKSVVNAACYTFYRDGKSKMADKKYTEAAQAFQSAYEINPNYLEGGNAYNLGKAYSAMGETNLANTYFQYVVDTFPGTDYASWASYRIVQTTSEGE
ncbi:MAG: tetratricopeptide repeat protein [Saccharofermentanales bacterium]